MLLESKRCNPNAPNTAGDTALHMAFMHRNFPAVKLLLDHEANVLAINNKGDAPIHKTFDIDCLNLLIGRKNCDPNQQNANGDTALHNACGAANKGSEYAYKAVRTLLCAQNIDPECVNHNGETPIVVAGTHYEIIKMISNLIEQMKRPVQTYVKIFVVGNSGNGKSTLIKAITTEARRSLKYFLFPKARRVRPHDVPSHTAGIVPIPFNSKHFGLAVLYDFTTPVMLQLWRT